MEGEMKFIRLKTLFLLGMAAVLGLFFPSMSPSQEKSAGRQAEEAAQLQLRKTPSKTRQYGGKIVEGEERVINRGDSLWRIIVQEKGLSEKHFDRYLVIIGSLNPHLKKPDVLQVGQTIFIPIRPDEILGIELSAGKGETKLYRVKQGDYLYKILREQFGIQKKQELRSAFENVKGLNPGKKDWNILFVGEGIVFSEVGKALASPTPDAVKPAETVGLDYARKLPVHENLQLLEEVMAALGNETQRGGEEVLALQEGTIRIDRGSYPIIRNPKVEQRVILDTAGTIPSSLKSKLEAHGSAMPVVSVKKGDSLHDVVSSLLSRLGYQSLPSNRPVEIRDGGVGVQVRGEWMVTAPEERGGKQDVIIINLTDVPSKTPDYLRDYLSLKGMSLKEILLPSPPLPFPAASLGARERMAASQIENWPRDKDELIDSLLTSYGITFGSAREISIALREGIRLDTRVDRLFEFGGKKIALIFRVIGEEAKKALQEKEGIRLLEFDVSSLSSREIISRLLEILGEKTAYRDHRFPAVEGAARDKMVLSVSGFFLTNRSLLLTDREIPKGLQRFFAEKGLRVVHF